MTKYFLSKRARQSPLCKECLAFAPSATSERIKFSNGKFYLASGHCNNAESQLFTLRISGETTATANGWHWEKIGVVGKLTCFRPRRQRERVE